MPGQLALLLYILFVICLFFLERKNKAKTSWALWLPLIYVLIQASRPLALWLNPGAQAVDDTSEGSPVDRVFYIFLIINGVLILIKRKIKWSLLIKNNLLIFLLFLYCGFSIVWSDVPQASFNAWVKVIVIPLMSLVIVTEENAFESFKTVMKRATYILIPLSIVLIKYYPTYGRSYSPHSGTPFYGGVTQYKNGLGVLCFITGLFLVWDLINMLRDKTARSGKSPLLINIILIGMVVWLLLMSNSATAEGVAIVGCCILIAFEMPQIKSNIKSIDIIVVGILFVVLMIFISFNALEGVITSLGRDMTLTGRTVIWDKVLKMGSNPIIGTGYGSFWLGDRGEFLLDLNWQRLTQAHNGYIEVYVNLGLIGLGLLIATIISTYKKIKIRFTDNFQYGKLSIMYLTVFLLTNITEATFSIKSIEWFIFVFLSIQYSKSTDNWNIDNKSILHKKVS